MSDLLIIYSHKMKYKKGQIVRLGDLCPERLREHNKEMPAAYNGLGKVMGYEDNRVCVHPCYGRIENATSQYMGHPIYLSEDELDTQQLLEAR